MNERLKARAGHALLGFACAGSSRCFLNGLDDLERVQRRHLAGLLAGVASVDGRIDPGWGWEEYRAKLPVTNWRDWSGLIARQRGAASRLLIDSPVLRYQPTSGSTAAIKWVPYTRRFLAELDAAIAPWLLDLYRRHPAVRQGRHYWSLSWLPTTMRDGACAELNDDSTLMSAGKRTLMRWTQSVPAGAALTDSCDDSLFVTLACLAADRDLSALSVWSPTFALNLFDRLGLWREALAEALEHGRWHTSADASRWPPCPRNPSVAALLRQWDGRVEAEFLRTLWPRLALVSAWDTAAAAPWAARLRSLLPEAAFQGKGLWATEGVVTIPFADRHLLAYRSHVYEFENLDDGRLLAPWELRVGQCVVPVLSTGSGLLRYRMSDVLRVDDFVGTVPALSFLGRDDGTDLVGEKMAATFAQSVLHRFAGLPGLLPLSLLALDDSGAGLPGYVMLVDDLRPVGAPFPDTGNWATQLEQALAGHFHYRLARNLGQLDPARVLCRPGLRAAYADQCRRRGMIEGNIKVEALRHWRGAESRDIVASLRAVAGIHAPEIEPA